MRFRFATRLCALLLLPACSFNAAGSPSDDAGPDQLLLSADGAAVDGMPSEQHSTSSDEPDAGDSSPSSSAMQTTTAMPTLSFGSTSAPTLSFSAESAASSSQSIDPAIACKTLLMCCGELPATAQSSCVLTANTGAPSACVQDLVAARSAGYCVGAPGADAGVGEPGSG